MPELPEVEVTKKGISPYIEGNIIKNVIIRNYQLRNNIPHDLLNKIKNLKLKKITRRAKYLIFSIGKGFLIIHLGMSGRLYIIQSNKKNLFEYDKHDHVDIFFENNIILRYRDPRRFGLIDWYTGNLLDYKYFNHLGLEPFDKCFNEQFLYNAMQNTKKTIKSVLMDSTIVVGIGNIYANEILFVAGVLPTRIACTISLEECTKLVKQIRCILKKSINLGGSSLKDFYHTDGSIGYFQQSFYVYSRNGKKCKICNSNIKSKIIGQRNTFFCAQCQQ